MRLGLLGPANGQGEALERAARFLHQELAVQRAVYLGTDSALDELVRRWAESLVGADPADHALWNRAAESCVGATPHEIGAFLVAERERRSLSIFESLPGDGTRLLELLGGRVVVMIHDKADLDEDDIASANVLVYGKSGEPLVKQVGSRWFLSPGSLDHFGMMVLEDLDDGIHLALFDNMGREIRRERFIAGSGPRLSMRSPES